MRILALSNIYPPGFVGGYELGASELLAGLAGRGHEVNVLTSSYLPGDDEEVRSGGPIVWRGLECASPSRSPSELAERQWLGAFALPGNLREVAGKLQTLKPEAVLCFNLIGLGGPALSRLFTCCGLRPLFILMDNLYASACLHPDRKLAFERVFSRECWPSDARLLYMSRGLQTEIEAALGMQSRDSAVVPGWYHPAAEAAVTARDEPITRFVFASQVAGHKGVNIVLEAARRLLDSGCSAFRIDFFGKGEVSLMLQRIIALGLADHAHYAGAPEKVALMRRLRDYEALLFPTWHREPFGFIVAEAAVAGCIPIVTYGAGAAEWFIDEYDCFKIERDAAALQAAMLRVMLMPRDARTTMRERAQTTSRRFFSFSSILDKVEASLPTALENRQEPRRIEAALAIMNEIWRTRQHVTE